MNMNIFLKNKKMRVTGYIVIIGLLVSISSCIHRDFDEPPIKEIPEGKLLTIEELRQIYVDSVRDMGAEYYKFVDEYSVFATVTMDEKSGNIYRSSFVQDHTGGINLRLRSPGGLYLGDSVRIYLKGTNIGAYREMLQLDSVDVQKNIIKQATHKFVEPEVVTIGQIKAGGFQAKLIKLEDVQFVESDLGKTYANAIGLSAQSRYIENCQGEELIVRTSGYASFAGDTLPEGKGSIIAIISQYDSMWQLYIRETEEVKLSGNRCGDHDEFFSEDFAGLTHLQEVDLEGWKNINQIGDIKWMGSVQGSPLVSAAQITGDGNENITWLITPEINITENTRMSFDSRAADIAGAQLEVMISVNYDGGENPQNANWVALTANIANSSSGFSSWVNSGSIFLGGYHGAVHIAFRYSTQNSQNGRYFIDNLILYNE